jgi:hypothetical protein
MVTSYSLSHGCRRSLHFLYKSALGNQNTLHGAVLCVLKSFVKELLTGFLCGCPCQTQSRQEVKYRHTLDAAITIYRSEGPRAFYRGLLPSLLGIIHVAVQFPLYEQLKVWASKLFFINVTKDEKKTLHRCFRT